VLRLVWQVTLLVVLNKRLFFFSMLFIFLLMICPKNIDWFLCIYVISVIIALKQLLFGTIFDKSKRLTNIGECLGECVGGEKIDDMPKNKGMVVFVFVVCTLWEVLVLSVLY